MFRSKVTEAMYEMRAMVILHEMAHMWFGDLVTMKWWDDLWLNESFAEYVRIPGGRRGHQVHRAWTTFCGGTKAAGYLADQQPSTHPIAANVPTLSEAHRELRQHQLREGRLGAQGAGLLPGAGCLLHRHPGLPCSPGWGNATLADLLGTLEASSGRSLTEWSKAWLETAGPNTLRPEFTVDADGAFTRFAVLQEAPPEHPTLRPHHIAIGLYERGSEGTLVQTHQVQADLAGARTEVPGLIGQPQPDLVMLNDDDLDYAIIRFDERSLATLTESIGRFRDRWPATICWTAVLDMLAAGRAVHTGLRRRYWLPAWRREPSVSVLQNLHTAGGSVPGPDGRPGPGPRRQGALADEAMRLLHAAAPGSDHQLAWAQMLGWTATAPDQLDLLAGLLDGSEVSRAWPSIRTCAGRCCSALPRWAGPATRRSTPSSRATTPTPGSGARRPAVRCAATPSTRPRRGRLLAEPRISASRTPSRSASVSTSLSMPSCSPTLRRAAISPALPEIWSTAGRALLRVLLGQLLFPYPAASPELLERIDVFLAAAGRDPAWPAS